MIISSYEQAREYLESFIRPSVFERIEEDSHMEDPLDRMRVLLSLLDNPQKKFMSVQVSGTSGKGSTSYLLNNILVKAGYKTGLATSPHLQRITERMLINNSEIDELKFLELVQLLIPAVTKMKKMPEGEPSYFELLTALAFMHFAREKVDIAVVEVGLEGKYDATNVLEPDVVILTNISKDHTELLGNTVDKIAIEALSIVRRGEIKSPIIVSGITQKSILHFLKKRAKDESLLCKILGEDIRIRDTYKVDLGVIFDYEDTSLNLKGLYVSLRGEYQVANASLAIAAAMSLVGSGFSINPQAIKDGLKDAFFAGRFEVINYTLNAKHYTLILDGAHNDAKMNAFLQALDQYYPKLSKTFIVGYKKNKDSTVMSEQLSLRDGSFIFTQFHKGADYARTISMTTAELRKNVPSAMKVRFTEDVVGALKLAVQSQNTIIVVTGSLYLVGEARSLLLAI